MAVRKGKVNQTATLQYTARFICDDCENAKRSPATRFGAFFFTKDVDKAWEEFRLDHVLCSGHEVDIVTGEIVKENH